MSRTVAFAPELLCVDGAFQRDRCVTVAEDGTVANTGFARDYPQAERFPRRVLLPGLVNAHSHAFQRIIRGTTEAPTGSTGNFWTWRDAMYRAANALDPEAFRRVARMAFLEMALSGITAVGEFHYVHRQPDGSPYDDPNLLARLTVDAAREVGIRICLLRVAYARAGWGKPANAFQARFIESSADEFLRNAEALRASLEGPGVSMGVAPHSVRAVPLPYLREVAAWAAASDIPIHMHASEQPGELAESQAEYGLTPVALVAREQILSPRFTAVHGIHISQEEIDALGHSGALVCACPTTERNLGDGIVPARALLDRGVPVALGTDSQALIDLLEDARELDHHLRLRDLGRGIIGAQELLNCLTSSGAQSLRLPSNRADFFTLDLDDISIAGAAEPHLLPSLVFGAQKTAVRDVIVGGRVIVRNGRHPQQEQIVRDYTTTCRELYS